jgi:hypothetical protein
MTTPAFNHLIAINTDHHVGELRQVAADLRNERALAAEPARARTSAGPNRLRVAIGTALVSLGTAVAATPRERIRAR